MSDADPQFTKLPQFSEMFQKFALAVKTKTSELFADEENSDEDDFSFLESTEEVITGQRVVVIKPDPVKLDGPVKREDEQETVSISEGIVANSTSRQEDIFSQVSNTLEPTLPLSVKPKIVENAHIQKRSPSIEVAHSLISWLFATISSFEASYIQLQAAHVPFVEENVRSADRAAVSQLKKVSDIKLLYSDYMFNPTLDRDMWLGSSLEAQVQENQNKLRALETVSNRLQSEIDAKDAEVRALTQELSRIRESNASLSERLGQNFISSCEVLLTARLFDSVLHDASRALSGFSKVLIGLIKAANWNLELAANSVYPGIDYVEKGHNRYALLSYVSLVMFQGFDSLCFGLEVVCNGKEFDSHKNVYLRQFFEHVMSDHMEVLKTDPSCDFSRFCEQKYQELIHPTMESSLFSNLDPEVVVLNSWKSSSVFNESFVNMASSIWMLHKLAFSFDSTVEIFQVERGAEFSMVYMQDVTRRPELLSRTRGRVGFTVVPGFKVGGIVLQCQVYLTAIK